MRRSDALSRREKRELLSDHPQGSRHSKNTCAHPINLDSGPRGGPEKHAIPPGTYNGNDTLAHQGQAGKRRRILFTLSPGCDANQWIVYRQRKRREESYLQPLAYIATTKVVLLRVLREKGIECSAEALAHLDALPDHFISTRGDHP